jgi:hypothetical protein
MVGVAGAAKPRAAQKTYIIKRIWYYIATVYHGKHAAEAIEVARHCNRRLIVAGIIQNQAYLAGSTTSRRPARLGRLKATRHTAAHAPYSI